MRTRRLLSPVALVPLCVVTMALGLTHATPALSKSTKTKTFGSGDLAEPIDFGVLYSPQFVSPLKGTIKDVDVFVRLDYGVDANLNIALEPAVKPKPGVSRIYLSTANGGAGSNYGSGSPSCAGHFTVFDDGAKASLPTGTAPFAGSFTPEEPLGRLEGKRTYPHRIFWQLRLEEIDEAASFGTLYCWKIKVTYKPE
jgi:hypothetical protein